MLSVIS
jgi:hypothetical protein